METQLYTDSHGQRFTNKKNHPLAFVHAVLNDSYSRGDSEYSATTLISPPRIEALKNIHKNDIILDIDDRVFILYGKMGHELLETAGRGIGRGMVEHRFFGTINGTKISAQIDSLDLEEDGTLTDYKFTTVYGFKRGSKPKDDWIKQMNIQLELILQNPETTNGLKVERMRIWGLLRDWRPSESKRGAGYPNKLAYHSIPMHPREKTQAMIARAIDAHKAAKERLPLCTSEDNWDGKRCADYCDVSSVCDQYQKRNK